MKKIFILASIIYSLNCFSQDLNPLLFQTWYLRFVQSNDFAPAYDVILITPTITPTLTISNTLNFTGLGACNTFNGSFANVDNNYWNYGSFSESGIVCSSPNHNNFEDNYFGFLQSQIGTYQIYPEGSGLVLRMDNPIFGKAIFQNFSLKSTDFELKRMTIYPNPTKDKININNNQLVITKIQITNSLGQNVIIVFDDFEVLDISALSSGIYILKIDTEIGTTSKKIIKE